MDLLEIMRTRRSVRSYKQEEIPQDALEKIIQAGLLSASGKAIRPWEFIVVKDKEMMEKLSDFRTPSVKMLKEAMAAIVVIADTTATDVWVEDCSAVMSNMHLMTHALGLGSCWVQGRLRKAQDGRDSSDFVKDLLEYPENYQLQAILTIGVPNEEKEGYDLSALPMDKVHTEKF